MNENEFEVVKNGTTLEILLGKELSTANSPALTEELSKYFGQDIEKVVFNATGLAYLSSSGIRAIFYANQRLGGNPPIVFVNCAKEVYNVLGHVGLTSIIQFEESMEKKKEYRRKVYNDLDAEETEQLSKERREALDNYEAHNDVVCYSMNMRNTD